MEVSICRNRHVCSEVNEDDPGTCVFCDQPANRVPLSSAQGIMDLTPEQRAELSGARYLPR